MWEIFAGCTKGQPCTFRFQITRLCMYYQIISTSEPVQYSFSKSRSFLRRKCLLIFDDIFDDILQVYNFDRLIFSIVCRWFCLFSMKVLTATTPKSNAFPSNFQARPVFVQKLSLLSKRECKHFSCPGSSIPILVSQSVVTI